MVNLSFLDYWGMAQNFSSFAVLARYSLPPTGEGEKKPIDYKIDDFGNAKSSIKRKKPIDYEVDDFAFA